MSERDQRRHLGSAFEQGGADYERLRPGYPSDAVAWMLEGTPEGMVADIGAGTGKLTRSLVESGREVVAVEPSRDMLDSLSAHHPDVEARLGAGENTGLEAASVAAVVYGQAWHWVEPEAGCAEAARILRPGGTLGLIWNFMDLEDPAVAAFNRAMHVLYPDLADLADRADSSDDVTAPFTGREVDRFSWTCQITTADLAALVTTRSYYLARPEHERADIRAAVADAVTSHVGPIGDTLVGLPHTTEVHRYLRP